MMCLGERAVVVISSSLSFLFFARRETNFAKHAAGEKASYVYIIHIIPSLHPPPVSKDIV